LFGGFLSVARILFADCRGEGLDCLRPEADVRNRPLSADSVEKVGFSNGLNSGTTTIGEPTHHIEWFFGPLVTFAALLLG